MCPDLLFEMMEFFTPELKSKKEMSFLKHKNLPNSVFVLLGIFFHSYRFFNKRAHKKYKNILNKKTF